MMPSFVARRPSDDGSAAVNINHLTHKQLAEPRRRGLSIYESYASTECSLQEVDGAHHTYTTVYVEYSNALMHVHCTL